jgi:hypothetical protein
MRHLIGAVLVVAAVFTLFPMVMVQDDFWVIELS